MRTVHLTITIHAVVKVDEGIEIGELLDSAEPTLKLGDDRADEIDCQIISHEVTDSR